MKEIIERGATSQIVHVFIPDSASTTGAGKTGLTFNSAGLKVVVMRPGESGATKYLQSAGNIEDITTIGTYAAPTANKCRFKEIDATDLPGWYELHFADALFNTTSSRRSLGGMISGASGVAPTPFAIQLADPVRGVASPTALPNAAAEAAGGLFTRGTGAGQINQAANGQVDTNAVAVSGDAVAADNAEAFFDGTGYAGTGNVIPTVTTLTNDPSGVTTLLSRVPSGIFTGITSLAQWLGLIAGKQTGNATARTELRATGAGSGTFDETTDSQEAVRDRGDAAWTTATGFSTHTAADVWAVATRTLTAFDASFKTGYALSSAGVQAIWDALTSALTTVGSIGKLLVDNVNATISSRSSHSAADVWAAVTRTLTAATNITSTGGTTVPQTGDNFARLGAPAGASVSADVAAVKGDTAAIKAKTDNLPADPADASDIAALFDALPTAAENAAALLDLADGVETGLTPRQALRLMAAAMAGKLSGAATTTIVIRNAVADSKNRITATVDADGNRSAVTVDLT